MGVVGVLDVHNLANLPYTCVCATFMVNRETLFRDRDSRGTGTWLSSGSTILVAFVLLFFAKEFLVDESTVR